MPPFDPDSVKIDHLKDPAKIKAKLVVEEAKYQNKWEEEATLSPSTATVLAIGIYRSVDEVICITGGEDEEDLLSSFWRNVAYVQKDGGIIVSFYGNRFDLPFIINRSRILGIWIPEIFSHTGYLDRKFVDLWELWKMPRLFTSDPKPAKMDYLAKVFGCATGKLEGVTGDQFHVLWHQNREMAFEYLRRDVATTLELAQKMGVC